MLRLIYLFCRLIFFFHPWNMPLLSFKLSSILLLQTLRHIRAQANAGQYLAVLFQFKKAVVTNEEDLKDEKHLARTPAKVTDMMGSSTTEQYIKALKENCSEKKRRKWQKTIASEQEPSTCNNIPTNHISLGVKSKEKIWFPKAGFAIQNQGFWSLHNKAFLPFSK